MWLLRSAYLILESIYVPDLDLFLDLVSFKHFSPWMYPSIEVTSRPSGPTSQRESIVQAPRPRNKISKCFDLDAVGKTSSRMAYKTFLAFYDKDGENKRRLAQRKEGASQESLQL